MRADRGPLLCVAATIAGVLVGSGIEAGRATVVAVAACSLALLVRVALPHAGAVAAALCCVGVAIACAARAVDGVEHHALLPAMHSRAPIVLRGELKSDPRPGRFDTTVFVRADAFAVVQGPLASRSGATVAPAWQQLDRTVMLRATATAAAGLGALVAGDHIVVEGDAAALTGYNARYRWQHAVALVNVDADGILGYRSASAAYASLANGLRAIIERGLAPLNARDHALLDGFLLGDTRAIDDQTTSDFRDAGLSHLLAVSGANVAFVLALVGPLQRRLPTMLRFLAGVAVVGVFAAMTRFEPSVLRASAMVLVTMTARASGRPVRSVRSLSYAVIALLVIDPFLVHSVGFQLSACACAGIALLARPIERRMPGPQWMRTVLGVTIAAQVGVAPVLVAVFGTVAWIAPATNLLAVPAAEPITVLAIPIAVVGAWSAMVAGWAFTPVRAMLWWVRAVAHVGAAAPVVVACAATALVVVAAVIVRTAARNVAVGSRA